MRYKIRLHFLIPLVCLTLPTFSQTWVDTLDLYVRESYLPASQYHWRWTHAALLNTMIKEYEWCEASQKQKYFEYIKKAMDKTYGWANGKTPNAVSSGMGMAFLYRVTKEEKYRIKAEKIYEDYLKIRRTDKGAVSHLMLFTELWDDTVFMIGEYMLAMYQSTGDSRYLDEFIKQFRLHREKLQDKELGLWYHGWDSDDKIHCTFCSQMHWADKVTRRSSEIWGRGNGWIIVTLSDVLESIRPDNPYWPELAGCLKEMIITLPELQNKKTGHWFQLPVRNRDQGNFLESSCTAMFAYGISAGLRLGIVDDSAFPTASLAYLGLRKYSLEPTGKNYLNVKNVCSGTCIGDKNYYFKRKKKQGTPFGLGMMIQFGLRYEFDNGLRLSNSIQRK